MPLAEITMMEGRTEDQKRAVIQKVTQAIVEAVGAPIESVRVVIREVPKTNWGIGGVSAKDLGRGGPRTRENEIHRAPRRGRRSRSSTLVARPIKEEFKG